MHSQSLTRLAQDQLVAARAATSGRAALTVYGGREHRLRQTVVALITGHALAEHQAPAEATLQVLVGQVRMAAGADSWEGSAGDHLVIPHRPHDLVAVTDAVVLLTVLTR